MTAVDFITAPTVREVCRDRAHLLGVLCARLRQGSEPPEGLLPYPDLAAAYREGWASERA